MHKLIGRKPSGSLGHGSIGPQRRIQHDMPIIISLCDGSLVWKFNPRDRTITLTKLLIKHEKLTPKETEIGA